MLNKIRFVTLLGILLLVDLAAWAQPEKLNLPNIIKPAPSVQNFMRYGEIPVDYSTGVPSISVPLYTVTSRKLSLPISISYHASGIKVQDKASTVGLGWVLNAGGFMTMTSLGGGGAPSTYKDVASFEAARAALQTNIGDLKSWGYGIYNEISYQKWKSDRYSYQLPNGKSGVYRYDFKTGDLIKLPYNGMKFRANNINNINAPSPLGAADIIDEDGTRYAFALRSSNPPMTSYLSSMISADGTDTIRFTYKAQKNTSFQPRFTSVAQLYCYPTVSGPGISFERAANQSSSITPGIFSDELLPDSIITATTIVTFTAVNDRLDMESGFGKYRITGFQIFRRSNGQLLRSVTFDQGYFGSAANNNLRLRLNGLTLKGGDQLGQGNYSFDYENSVELPPYPENLNGTNANYRFREDYWGYYNGTASYSMVPRPFTPTYVPDYATSNNNQMLVPSDFSTNRDPDSLYAKAAMLKVIHYPTGGKTEFDFEPNRAAYAYQYPPGTTVPDIVGGFRIRRITSFTAEGQLAWKKSYAYSSGKTRPVSQDLYSDVQRTFTTMYVPYPNNYPSSYKITYPVTIISSEPFLPLTCDHGPPVFYDRVVEYQGNANGQNTGKTVYTYQTPPATTNTNPQYDNPAYSDAYLMDMGNYVPQLLNKKDYKSLQNGQYVPVREEQNTYTAFLGTNYAMGLRIHTSSYPGGASATYQDYNYSDEPYNTTYYDGSGMVFGVYGAANLYVVTDLLGTQQIELPTQNVVREYDAADSTRFLATTTNLAYDGLSGYTLGANAQLQPSQRTLSSSTGTDSWITRYGYAQDKVSQQPYSAMVGTYNLISPVIEQTEYKNDLSNFIRSTRTDYSFWSAASPTGSSTSQIYPAVVQAKKAGMADHVPRVRYRSYDDRGNITGVSKEGGPQVSYVWGYNKEYPIAQVTGTSAQNVFYESFEEGRGNQVTAHTGYYAYSGSYTRTVYGLQNGSYRLSYWQRTGNDWLLQRSAVQVTSGSYTINVSGLVDDIRLQPGGTQMVTYTYEPLVGQTSMTDAKNEVVYYEYDGFQRLINVRDKDRNIKAHYCYNLAGQLTDCTEPYVPPAPTQPLIYARLEVTNLHYVSNNGSPYVSYDNMDVIGDVAIRLYSDAACTQSYTLQQNMDIDLEASYEATDQYGQYQHTYLYNYQGSAGYSYIDLGTQTVSSTSSYYDYWYGTVSSSYSYHFQVVPKSSSNYQPVSSIGYY